MYKKVSSFVVSNVRRVKTNVTALMIAAIVGVTALIGSSPLYAQSQTIDVQVPDLDFAGVGTSVLSAVVPGLVAAIGLGLSVWAISFIYRKFKSMGK
jgi:hypothetical protein